MGGERGRHGDTRTRRGGERGVWEDKGDKETRGRGADADFPLCGASRGEKGKILLPSSFFLLSSFCPLPSALCLLFTFFLLPS